MSIPVDLIPQGLELPSIGQAVAGGLNLGAGVPLGLISAPGEAISGASEYASNPQIVPPDLKELLSFQKWQVKAEINKILIGKIVTFDSTKQTATIDVSFKRVIKGGAPATNPSNMAVDRIVEYPTLVNCPVVVMSGGESALHMPIAAGDFCLVLFCDRDIDGWFTTGNALKPNSARIHDLNDGIALVGIKPSISPITSFITDGPALVNTVDAVKTVISAQEKVLIQVGEQTLKDLFSSMIDQVKSTYTLIQTFYGTMENLVTATGDVLNAATKATIIAETTQIANAISEFNAITTKVNGLFK